MEDLKKLKPMYFASLKLQNVKCFGKEQTLKLTDDFGAISPWTLILGNNGLGKTTLLKCLAWMTTTEEIDQDKKKEAQIPDSIIAVKPAIDGIENFEYEQLSKIGKDITSIISATLTNGSILGCVPEEEEIIDYSIEFRTINGKLEEVKPIKLFPIKEYNTPLIYAYSASRHMELQNLDKNELFNSVSNLFSESGELYDATEQLLFQDHAALQENPKGRETALLEKMKKLIADLLPEVISSEDITIHAKERVVRIKTDDGKVPLDSLSLGYKTMVAWSVDLALKMFKENPASETPLEEPGVVIIDEIDLHLHPSWQRELKQILTRHFTKTQFISTSHSPFIAQSSEEDNLAVLQRNVESNNEVLIENSPHIVKGWRIGQIVTSDLFSIPNDRKIEIENAEDERLELINKEDLSEKEKETLNQLDEEHLKLPILGYEDQQLLNLIREGAQLLKEKGKLK